jgi:hypothetical protein
VALAAWCKQVQKDFETEDIDPDDLPIFPVVRTKCVAEPGFKFHSDSILLRYEIVDIFEQLNIISPRTGEPLKVTPHRFRYTLALRAVLEKAGAAVIAELLDHEDTQNVMVYLKLSDDVIEEIEAELADELEPLVRAFRGELVLFDDDSSDPGKLIRYPGVDPKKGNAGRCRGAGSCGAVIPVQCYVCPYFTAFADGPHEDVLAYLLAEKQNELELGGDETVAGSTDEAILAVKAVIRKSKEILYRSA